MHHRPRLAFGLLGVLLLGGVTVAGAEDPESAALELPPTPAAVEALLEAPGPEAATTQRRIEHGRWAELGDATLTVPQAARLLRAAGVRPDRWAGAGEDASTGTTLERARAWELHGRHAEALEALPEGESTAAGLVRARCLLALGRAEEAAEAVAGVLAAGDAGGANGADARCDLAEALLLADRLGTAGPDAARRASALLDEATELAPLDARPRRLQAALLFARDNRPEGGAALEAALARNPLDAGSLRLLGEVSLDGFDFDRAAAVEARLRELPTLLPVALRPEPAAEASGGGGGGGHPLADGLAARSLLRADDAAGAAAVLRAAGPGRADLLPALAAAEAVRDPDGPAAAAALAAAEAAAPGSPDAHAAAGAALAEARQYPEAVAHLREAIRRRPSDPGPHHELGTTLAQAGDLPGAVDALRVAVRLDPFQSAAANSLALFERMLTWPVEQTEHFDIRHAPGVDAVLAADMAREVEALRASVTSFFDHEPGRRTQIDLLPDAPSFAVRITGRPELWTIAACTGDVVAMTPPRLGPDQAGAFHWRNVLRHEYAHTVTLDRTRNRIAHWLTEAAAVNAESVGRAYDQARLLADALQNDGLFAYEDLSWGFIRPEKPSDRGLAYAQSAWMLEHVVEVDGRGAMLAMLDAAGRGATDAEALAAATGAHAGRLLRALPSLGGGGRPPVGPGGGAAVCRRRGGDRSGEVRHRPRGRRRRPIAAGRPPARGGPPRRRARGRRPAGARLGHARRRGGRDRPLRPRPPGRPVAAHRPRRRRARRGRRRHRGRAPFGPGTRRRHDRPQRHLAHGAVLPRAAARRGPRRRPGRAAAAALRRRPPRVRRGAGDSLRRLGRGRVPGEAVDAAGARGGAAPATARSRGGAAGFRLAAVAKACRFEELLPHRCGRCAGAETVSKAGLPCKPVLRAAGWRRSRRSSASPPRASREPRTADEKRVRRRRSAARPTPSAARRSARSLSRVGEPR